MGNRFLVVGYIAKDGMREFSAVKGYHLESGEPIPPHSKIRNDCLEWANNNGDSFSFFSISWIKFVSEEDYISFMDAE